MFYPCFVYVLSHFKEPPAALPLLLSVKVSVLGYKMGESCNQIPNNTMVCHYYLLHACVCVCVFSKAVIHGSSALCGFEV